MPKHARKMDSPYRTVFIYCVSHDHAKLIPQVHIIYNSSTVLTGQSSHNFREWVSCQKNSSMVNCLYWCTMSMYQLAICDKCLGMCPGQHFALPHRLHELGMLLSHFLLTREWRTRSHLHATSEVNRHSRRSLGKARCGPIVGLGEYLHLGARLSLGARQP